MRVSTSVASDRDVVHDLWNRGARRATVLIESAERDALAILIDDSDQPSYYRVENDLKSTSFRSSSPLSCSR
jgi:hypothetical protein